MPDKKKGKGKVGKDQKKDKKVGTALDRVETRLH